MDETKRPKISSEGDSLYPKDRNKDNTQINQTTLRHLRGKTLDIYYYLVSERRDHGVREIQRYFNYSSPSIASYHLTRLLDNGLIQKSDSGNYYVEGDPVKLGELKDHVTFAGLFIPRITLYGFQIVVSLIITILLYLSRSNIIIWFWYFLVSNLGLLIFIIRDSFIISQNLKSST